jgi:RNA polymerase sigma-70 factor (ECF subfamily)
MNESRDDLLVVRRLLAGDEEAFDSFVEDYYPRLYRFAYPRVGRDAEAAQDVVQSTFGKVISQLKRYRGEAALFSWICSICRFEIAAYWREQREAAPEIELIEESAEVRAALESLSAAAESIDRAVEKKELAQLVRAALDALPVNYGNALEWKYLRGWSVRDIAERLNVSPKAAESLLTRSRGAFRDAFQQFSGRWRAS